MTLYPHAQWRPLDDTQPSRMAAHDLIILHTMVGSLASTDAYFKQNGYGGTESHFGVGHDGTTYQWTDLDCRADANLDANSRAISIETADWGEGDFGKWDTSNPALVPAWTDAQVETLAQIVAWCCDRYGIPCVLTDAAHGSRGVSYHRKGIDDWRRSTDEHWSTSRGKVCPGDRRVAQVTTVINRAAAILAGDGEDDDMSAEAERMIKELHDHLIPDGIARGQTTVGGTIAASLGTAQGLVNQVAALGAGGTSIIKLAEHDAQWLASPYDGTRTWIESQEAIDDFGLRGRGYETVRPDDERWKLAVINGRVPADFPQVPYTP